MAEQLNNLNIDSLLSKSDMDKLVELLGQNSVSLGGGNSKKKNKMTPQAKNFLLNQLSSHQKIQEVQTPFKDMKEEEKKTYREELKLRLRDKQNMLKQNRTNRSLLQKKLDTQTKKNANNVTKTNEINEINEINEVNEVNEVNKVNEVNEVNKVNETVVLDNTNGTNGTNGTAEQSDNLEDFVN